MLVNHSFRCQVTFAGRSLGKHRGNLKGKSFVFPACILNELFD